MIGDLFYVQTPKKKFNADSVSFGGVYPYVARGENNNGIRGYISEEEKYLNDGDTISFGQDTATMFYQSSPYFTGDKIKVFKPKNFELSRYSALYYITATKKTLKTFSWGSTSYNVKNLEKIEVEIPKKDEASPDTEFMENFIRVVEKLVIKDVVDWLDKKIEATKQVVKPI
nr:restriction endonuclease subunit S [uncultured Catonella sp.]